MNIRKIFGIAMLAFATLLSGLASAQTLYAATGSNGVAGNLFTVNPATAAATLVGPIVVGALPVSITGLAVHPATGVLYGATAPASPNLPMNLVTINSTTGAATVVGPLGTRVSDLHFNAAGTLFGWFQNAPNELATVNIATGAATAVGPSGLAAFVNGGGIAINAGGTAFVTVHGSAGTLDTVNTATGVGTAGPAMAGAPIAGSVNALAFSPAGTLFGVNSNQSGSPTTNFLVTINTGTGAITSIGALPGDTDAIAFAFPLAAAVVTPVPTMSEWALAVMALLMALAAFVAMRSRRS